MKTPIRKQKKRVMKTEESPQETERVDNDLRAMRKHIEELSNLKKATNESVLPQIKPKKEDIFV